MVKSHCSKCDQLLASPQSLWNHKQRCQGNPRVGENMMQEDGFQDANQKRSTTSTLDPYNKSSKNPKIRVLLNEIINDTTSENPNEEKASWKQSTTVLPSPPHGVVADLFKEKLPTPPLEVVAAVFPSTKIVDYSDNDDEETPPGTRGDIVGHSDDKQGDDEQSTDGEDDIRDSIDDIKPKGEDMEMEIEGFTLPDTTLPDTIEGVNKLYVEFMRHNKHEHTNELVFSQDALLRQGAITHTEYTELNTSLTEAADLRTDEAEKEDSDDEEKNLMKSAVDYIIKEELLHLTEELRGCGGIKMVKILKITCFKKIVLFYVKFIVDSESGLVFPCMFNIYLDICILVDVGRHDFFLDSLLTGITSHFLTFLTFPEMANCIK